jgi:hypothetical protein
MFSRIAAFAAALAIVTGASFAFTASAHQAAPGAIATKAVPVIQLERVVVTGKRLHAAAH